MNTPGPVTFLLSLLLAPLPNASAGPPTVLKGHKGDVFAVAVIGASVR